MLPAINHKFIHSQTGLKIAQALYDSGISIIEGKLKVNQFDVSLVSVARELGVNRKTVYRFIQSVEEDYVLGHIFSRLGAMPDIKRIAPILGYEVIMAETSTDNSIFLLEYLKTKVRLYQFNYIDGKLFAVYEPSLSAEDLDRLSKIARNLKVITPDTKKKKEICKKCQIEYCPRRDGSA